MQYRILQTTTEYPSSQSFLGPEADRTGTGKLTFANANDQENNDGVFFPGEFKQRESNKVVFPKEIREDYTQSNRVVKSLNIFNDLNAIKEHNYSVRKNRKFFPQVREGN